MRRLIALSGVLALALSLSIPADAVPLEFTNQGRIKDALGAPLGGFNSVSFSLHTAPAGGSAIWAETQTLEFTDGYFSAQLGAVNALNPDTFDGSDLYLSIAVNGGSPLPDRIKLDSVPYAFRALNAETATNVDGGLVNASEVRINGTTVIDSDGNPSVNWSQISGIPADFADGIDDEGSSALPNCGPDQTIYFNGTTWACVDQDDHAHSASQITGGTLNTDRLPMGTSGGTVAWGDHLHPNYSDSAHDHDSDYAAASHSHTPTGVDALSCSDGEVPQWNGGVWECGTAGGGGGGALLFSFELDGSAPYEDFSGNGNDLTWDGLGLTQGAAGHSGTGVNFSNGILIAGAGNSIFDSPTVTVESWIRPALPTDGDQTIIQKEGAYRLIQKRGSTNSIGTIEMQITAEDGSTCAVESTYTVEAGTWAHVAGAYNGRTISVGINDNWIEAVCEEGPLALTGGSPLNIGASTSKADAYNGLIDEIRGWAYAPPSAFLYYGGLFAGSTLLDSAEMAQLNEWASMPGQRWKLCYKKSVHGAGNSIFHTRCDNRGMTFTVMTLATGQKMGGFAVPSWNDNNNTYRGYNDNSFLFNLNHNEMYPLGGYHSGHSIYNHSSYCPTFGNGHDFYTFSNCNSLQCNFPYAYSYQGESYNNVNRNTGCQRLIGNNSGTTTGVTDMEVFVRDIDSL